MPLYEEYINIESFGKGINQSVDENLLDIDEANKCVNCKIDDGTLRLADGYETHTTLGTLDNDEIITHYNNGVLTTLIGKDGDIYNTSGTLIFNGTSGNWDYINYSTKDEQPITILTNGVDDVQVYDGSTFRPLLLDPNDSVSRAPKGKYIELHKERVWITGVSDDPNTLFFSDDLNPDDWTAPTTETEVNQHGGYIHIPTWDGGVIIGLENLFDDLFVFKTHNVFRIFGTYPGNYQIVPIFQETNGRIIEGTITSRENMVFWMSTEGIYHFGGTNTTPIHYKIQREFERINKSYIDTSKAVIYKNKLYIAVPCEASTIPNVLFIYDIVRDVWTVKEDISIKDMKVIDNELLFISTDDKIYKFSSSNKYGINNINATWESGYLDFGVPNAKKNILKVYFTGTGNGTVRFECVTERKTKQTDVLLDSEEKVYRIRLKNKGRLVKFRISNVNGSNFVIKRPQILYDMDID